VEEVALAGNQNNSTRFISGRVWKNERTNRERFSCRV